MKKIVGIIAVTISIGLLLISGCRLLEIHPTKALKWKFNKEGSVTTSPAVADGVVYFGSHDGYLYAVK